MKTFFRWLGIALFVVLLGFCVFGFVATFEPMPSFYRMMWRTAYCMVAFVSILGLARQLRCQWRCWSRRRSQGG